MRDAGCELPAPPRPAPAPAPAPAPPRGGVRSAHSLTPPLPPVPRPSGHWRFHDVLAWVGTSPELARAFVDATCGTVDAHPGTSALADDVAALSALHALADFRDSSQEEEEDEDEGMAGVVGGAPLSFTPTNESETARMESEPGSGGESIGYS